MSRKAPPCPPLIGNPVADTRLLHKPKDTPLSKQSTTTSLSDPEIVNSDDTNNHSSTIMDYNVQFKSKNNSTTTVDDESQGRDDNYSSNDELSYIEDQPEFISHGDDHEELPSEQLSAFGSNQTVDDAGETIAESPRVHDYTNIRTIDATETLLRWLRNSKVCKSRGNEILKLIKSWLPVPVNLPSKPEDLLSSSGVLNNFNKRTVCVLCETILPNSAIKCHNCPNSESK
ncbi:unnamed protein product, partial [Didymodactylos carnosus]